MIIASSLRLATVKQPKPSLDESHYLTHYIIAHQNTPQGNQTCPASLPTTSKPKALPAIEAVLADRPEAIVTVRGKDRFVVMEIEQYHHLRECELEAALAETRAAVAAGRHVKESAAEHVKRAKKSAS